ncbi:type II secretion system protein N [Dyella sp. BiH032]|uniref:type II secretion system protein N n=1 Tax=Dyella sp. BiH032 TaxID=3075430 RepID=UPI0028929A82|nr:type II secretion system protein N [Dyella sp. BiH032]WNL45320.1 type II secretion system protein N [Dyella sp. BiH032]
MIRLRTILWFLLLASALAWLVAYLPAAWVRPQLEARLRGGRLEGLSGTVWEGHADRLLASNGGDLGQLDWQLSRRALLGDTQLSVDLHGAWGRLTAQMRKLEGKREEWSQVHVDGDLAQLSARLAPNAAGLQGQLTIDNARVVLQGRWPLELDAVAQWSDARLPGDQRELSLGNLQLRANGAGGVVNATVKDDGDGPLQLAGRLALSPLGWKYDIKARPREPDPALRDWLAGFGRLAADGSMHVERSGGLAAIMGKGNR